MQGSSPSFGAESVHLVDKGTWGAKSGYILTLRVQYHLKVGGFSVIAKWTYNNSSTRLRDDSS